MSEQMKGQGPLHSMNLHIMIAFDDAVVTTGTQTKACRNC